MENTMSAQTRTIVKDKCRVYSVLGGLCALLFWIMPILRENAIYGRANITSFKLISAACCALFAIALFIGRKNIFLTVSAVVFCLPPIIERLMQSPVMLNYLIFDVVIFGSFLTIVILCCANRSKKFLKHVYYIPAVLQLIRLVYIVSHQLRNSSFSKLMDNLGMYYLTYIISALTLFFAAKWAVKDFEYIEVPVDPNDYNLSDLESNGGIDLAKHVLLLLFTFGIWQYIWIYRTTDRLNYCKNYAGRSPANQLLLCLFVPFYLIYWTYQSALRIECLAREKGMNESFSTTCLVLEIFIPIVPPILMQGKINSIITAPGSSADTRQVASQIGSADELKKYKELLDSGVITEEEFAEKKKQLLGL